MAERTCVSHGSKAVLGGAVVLWMAATVWAAPVKVTVENMSPANGLRITPVWVGIHNGSFDTFDEGIAASADLQKLAEDGDTSGVSGSFGVQAEGTILGPVTAPGEPPIYHPGEMGSMMFDVNPAGDVFLSFLSMAIPSNDAFMGNDNPMAYQIFAGGAFQPQVIDVFGDMLWDAGTEVNDEIAANVPLLGQAAPNTGADELGVVHMHGGFIPGGNILTAFPDADFTVGHYHLARITVEQLGSPIPAPASILLVMIGTALVGRRRFPRL